VTIWKTEALCPKRSLGKLGMTRRWAPQYIDEASGPVNVVGERIREDEELVNEDGGLVNADEELVNVVL
jgi:hypothetical protein